jgi:hypothetical protein
MLGNDVGRKTGCEISRKRKCANENIINNRYTRFFGYKPALRVVEKAENWESIADVQ